ncbi:FRIGIDA-like protein 1 [Senna tora]|uniref:FRIGIDA-like protein n=1 Tax=Senna tora TaxID=362788 RepID=A0A834WS99_9FABA|nr:FRIGIDA-like protein 1 [Senna tora]
MATLKTISAALKLVDTKKESLRKAYDDLHAHSSLLSSFSLSWSEIDSHFTSLHNSLAQRFHALESLESQRSLLPNSHQALPSISSSPGPTRIQNLNERTVVPRYELSVLCEKMEGKALRKYIVEHIKDKIAIQAELPDALRCAPDPAAMVLDSLDGFFEVNELKDVELRKLRRGCITLLEQLRVISPNIGFKVREQAKKLAVEWKGRLMAEGAKTMEALGFLHFVAAYGLVSEASMDELVDFTAMAANCEEVPELCRVIGLVDKIPDLVQKLVDKGKHVMAVKYVFEFNLNDKIPPVPILKACVDEANKLAKRLSQEGKPLSEVTAREIHALKTVIKVIVSHKLESEYPPASLEQRMELLKKQMSNRKRPGPASLTKPQQKKKKQRQRLYFQTSAPVGPANVANAASNQYQQPLVQPTGLLPEQLNPYMSLQAMPYGMVGPTPTISSYTGPSAGPYGYTGVPLGSSGNPSQGGSHLYTSEPHSQPGYYDRTTASNGYGLQHYYASYYPQ